MRLYISNVRMLFKQEKTQLIQLGSGARLKNLASCEEKICTSFNRQIFFKDWFSTNKIYHPTYQIK